MKTKNVIKKLVVSFFTMALFLVFSNVSAQTTQKHAAQNHKMKGHKMTDHKMKDCCMMKDGKMMMMKDGKTMPMDKTMTMKNGTTCMTNGECMMKDGTKMTMKEGECIGMDGKMCSENMKMMKKTTDGKKDATLVYTCPMHPEVVGVKGDKCSKCGMDLVKK